MIFAPELLFCDHTLIVSMCVCHVAVAVYLHEKSINVCAV